MYYSYVFNKQTFIRIRAKHNQGHFESQAFKQLFLKQAKLLNKVLNVAVSPGLHHDAVPAALLERRAPGLPQHKQPEHDLRQPPGEEDLGARHVLCSLQEVLHPRHHHGERHAESVPRWQRALQPAVGGPPTLTPLTAAVM